MVENTLEKQATKLVKEMPDSVRDKIDYRDNLYLPDFSFYLVPVTGHPNGFMYVYLKF